MKQADFNELLKDYKEYYKYVRHIRYLRDNGKEMDDVDILRQKVLFFVDKHLSLKDMGYDSWKDVLRFEKADNFDPTIENRSIFKVVSDEDIDFVSEVDVLERELLSIFIMAYALRYNDVKNELEYFKDMNSFEYPMSFLYVCSQNFHNRIKENRFLYRDGAWNTNALERIFGDLYDKEIRNKGYHKLNTKYEKLQYFYDKLAHDYFSESRKSIYKNMEVDSYSGVADFMALLEIKIEIGELDIGTIFKGCNELEMIKEVARSQIGVKIRDKMTTIGF